MRYDFGRGSNNRSARIPLDRCEKCGGMIISDDDHEVVAGKDYHSECARLAELERKIRGARMIH